MNPLLFLGLVVGTGWGTGAVLNQQGLDAKDMKPTIAGQNASLVVGIGGALLAVFGGPLGLVIGSGIAAGAAVSNNGVSLARDVFEKYIEKRILQVISDRGDGAPQITEAEASDLASNVMDLMRGED